MNGKAARQYAIRRSTSPGKRSSFRIVSTSRPEEFGKYTHPRTALEHQQRSQTLITLHLPLLKPPVFYDCYATESFAALVKQHVKLGSGSSDFTESGIWSGPQQASPASPYPTWPPGLPQITIARLLNSYFNNAKTYGFIDAVNLESVEAIVRQTHDGPSQMCNSDRCIVYLVLAIGLAFDSSPTERALQDPDLKERFFASAEALLQPSETYRGPESCNIVPWILQALVLMSFYMLCVSRPHAAHSYCSRAFQVAHSFGIHRGKETEVESFSGTQAWTVSRRNVWRSLFVLDRFLAATLGRPLTIHQHTEESLVLQKGTLLNPAVDACRIIGETVKVVYSGSKISMKDVKLLIGHLDSLTDAKVDPAPFVAQARVNSFRIYADILLCRPFFLLRFIASTEERESLDNIEPQINELSQRCVSGSIRAIDMLKEGTRPTSPLPVDPFIP
ncbi:transcription factor [Fusarium sporotrichioides]|uniref:Transcription factor n=1 Tax=Fusarium sporotrichioides TaxID=5514 RepID=A0A395RGP2_FUSSP|nr:transcription factor [Fusarium sporotrichioides]